jgi:hypothetical protein
LRRQRSRILGSDGFTAAALASEYVPPLDVSLKQVETTVFNVYGIDGQRCKAHRK